MKKLLIGLIAFFTLTTLVFAAYPSYSGFVNDYTNTLSKEEVQKLETKIKEYETQTTNQIAIALVKTTEPESIEEYSIHLADKWKPGQKGKDNGILMLFAMDDRKMRIEVGRGLEGSLTDLQATRIIDDVMVPEFKNKNYYSGINKGIDRIIVAVSPDSPIASVSAALIEKNEQSDAAALFVIIIVIILVVLIIAASPYTPIGGQGTWGITSVYSSTGGGFLSSGSSSGSSFGGGSFSGGGGSGSW